MKKLIYSMESKNRLNNILATGDALFFAIQLIIVEIHTRLTSQSLLMTIWWKSPYFSMGMDSPK